MALSNMKIKSLGDPGRYGDGGGLYLVVAKGGTKSWVQRVTINGKRRDLGLGGFPATGLAQARAKALSNGQAIALGKDPRATNQDPTIPTLREAGEVVKELRRVRWRTEKHAKSWLRVLEIYVYPTLGDLPVNEITQQQILKILEPIWGKKRETSKRIRERLRLIFRWSLAHEHITQNPAGEIIDGVLPPLSKKDTKHHKAIPYKEIPNALTKVSQSNAYWSTKLCFFFQVLTAARPGEARKALWKEISWEESVWVIPPEKMKTNVRHRVPLSTQSMGVLARAWTLRDESGLVFPSPSGRPLTDATVSKLIRELQVEAVPHGFRSTFRDWAEDKTDASNAAMEISLSHVARTETEGAYARGDLLEARRKLMQEWGDYIGSMEPLPELTYI